MTEMQTYTVTRPVQAKPMTLGEYCDYMKTEPEQMQDAQEKGYLISYPCVNPESDPVVGWRSEVEFDSIYKHASRAMDFGAAINAVKKGKRVARTGWNGKGMFVFLLQGSNDLAALHGYGFGEYPTEPVFRDALFMRTVDNQLVAWTISQSDALANDWEIVV